MTARDPLFVVGAAGAGQTSPTEARLAMAGLLAANASPLDTRGGVLYGPGSPLAVTGTSSMAYSVAAGTAVLNRSTALGPYIGSNDGAASVSTTAAPGAGTSRYDLIWIKFPDAEQGDADSAAILGVTQGTAAASPTVPATPTGAVALATALVPNGTTRTDTGVTITQVSPWTVGRGAPVPVRNQTERDALGLFDGLHVYRLDTHQDEVYRGSAWAQLAPWAFAAVTVTISGTGASAYTQAFTWPAGRFSQAPVCSISSAGGSGSSAFNPAFSSAPTTTGGTAAAYHRDGTVATLGGMTVHIIGIQMTSAAAAG